jgi:hypothetical protein
MVTILPNQSPSVHLSNKSIVPRIDIGYLPFPIAKWIGSPYWLAQAPIALKTPSICYQFGGNDGGSASIPARILMAASA